MDSYIVVRIPDIWSPIHPASSSDEQFVGYDFKWIENLGIHMIKEVEVTIGGQSVQHYSGHYLQSVKNRDFSNTKKELHDKMTGNIIEFKCFSLCTPFFPFNIILQSGFFLATATIYSNV